MDCDRRQHEAHAAWLCNFDDLGRCTGAAPCTQCFPRGDLGAAGRKSAKHAQYLLVTFGYPVVWLERKSNLVCSCHGLNAFDQHHLGVRAEECAEDLRYGWSKFGSERIAPFLVRAIAGQSSSSDLGTQAGMGLCLAVVVGRGDDLCDFGSWSAVDDGRDLNDINQIIAVMVLISAIGFLIDGLVFRNVESRLRRIWGISPAS